MPHAGLVGKYWFEKLARLPVEVDVASELRYRSPVYPPGGLALFVSRLVSRENRNRRFQFGYWHLEPLVGVLRDSILAVACIYAAVDAVNSLFSGGHEVEYGLAAWWAGILCTIGLAMTLVLRRRAKVLQSPMLELDARSWAVSTVLSLALLVGFIFATALAGSPWQGWIPYLDAIALLSMALIMLPVPLMGLWRSISDVLQVAPDELDARVRAVMDRVVKERAFLDYSSYVAKVGRGRFVEIHILVPAESRIDIAMADEVRRDVSDRLNAASPTFWLTIDFSADRRWI